MGNRRTGGTSHRGALLLALVLFVAAAGGAAARPLYAMRTGMACARCHVDPAGGGIRNATGFMYAVSGHTMTPAEEPAPTIQPKVADGLRFGADFRTLYLQEYAKETSGDRSTFFQMQSALYVAADVSPRVSLVYSNDLARTQEAFALIGGFPMQGTLKVGLFTPAFGIEDEDHTTFTRDSLGFGTNSQDTGVELSVAKGKYYGNWAFLNGNSSGGLTNDDNAQKAVIYRGRFYTDRFGAGVNGYYNNPGFSGLRGKRRYLFGAFGHLRQGPFVLMGEYDRGANEYERNSKERRDGRTKIAQAAAFAELSYLIGDRQTVKLKYDRFDRDLDLAETARDRLALGFDADVLPLARVIVLARGTREYGTTQAGRAKYGATRDTYDLLTQLHVSF